MIYIQADSTKKVLGTSNGIKVIEEEFQEGKSEQLWKIGEAMALQKAVCDRPYIWPINAEGYFTLENSKFPKLLTAITPFNLRLKGKFEMDSKYLFKYLLFALFLLTDPYNGNAVLATELNY